MNISIKELSSMRSTLESEYEKIEKEILSFIKKGKNADDLIKQQDNLDTIIDLIDRIISNLKETPKLYEQLIDLTDK